MKNTVIVLMLLLSFTCGFGQEEFSDYRSKKEHVLKMREKDLRADIATFSIAGIEERIGKEPLEAIRPKYYNDKEIYFEGKDIKVRITRALFQPEKHNLQYEEKHLVKIDKKPFYGSFGELPHSYISEVSVIVNNDTIAIPPAAYADLYDPSFTYQDASGNRKTQNAVFLSKDGRKIYVYFLNRSDSGSYEVTWVIQDKKYLRRVLDFDMFK